MLKAHLSSLTCSAQHNRHIPWSVDSQRAWTASLCHAPWPSSGTKLRNMYWSASDRCRFDQRSDLPLVSASRIYSHSFNRIVFTNKPNADITMCIQPIDSPKLQSLTTSQKQIKKAYHTHSSFLTKHHIDGIVAVLDVSKVDNVCDKCP